MGQTRLLSGAALAAAAVGATAALLWRRAFRRNRFDFALPPGARFELPAAAHGLDIAPSIQHEELNIFGRNRWINAAAAAPVQFIDDINHRLANGQRLYFIFTDNRPSYSRWSFNRSIYAIRPSESRVASTTLSVALETPSVFIAWCFRKYIESLLSSLIRAVNMAGLDASMLQLIRHVSLGRRLTLSYPLEPTISYSLWAFRRSLRAWNPSRARNYSSALTVGLQSPAEFLAIIARRYIESIFAMLRVAAMVQLETAATIRPARSTPVQPVSRYDPQFNAELAPSGHWRAPVIVIPLALARQYTRFLFRFRGATSISYSRWAFNMSIRARSVSQAPSSSALSVLLQSPMEFVVRIARNQIEFIMLFMSLFNRAGAISHMAEVMHPLQPEVNGGSVVEPNNFAQMFMRAAAASLAVTSSEAVERQRGPGPTIGLESDVVRMGHLSFAPHHLLDPAMRQAHARATLRAASIVEDCTAREQHDDAGSGSLSRQERPSQPGGSSSSSAAPHHLVPNANGYTKCFSCQLPHPKGANCPYRVLHVLNDNGIGSRSIIIGLSGSNSGIGRAGGSRDGQHDVNADPTGSQLGGSRATAHGHAAGSGFDGTGQAGDDATGRHFSVASQFNGTCQAHSLHPPLSPFVVESSDSYTQQQLVQPAVTSSGPTAHAGLTREEEGMRKFTQQAVRHHPINTAPQGRRGAHGDDVRGRQSVVASHGDLRGPNAISLIIQSGAPSHARYGAPGHVLHHPSSSGSYNDGLSRAGDSLDRRRPLITSSESEPRSQLVQQQIIASGAPTNARWRAPPVHVLHRPLSHSKPTHRPGNQPSSYNGVEPAGGRAGGVSHGGRRPHHGNGDRSRRSQAGTRRRRKSKAQSQRRRSLNSESERRSEAGSERRLQAGGGERYSYERALFDNHKGKDLMIDSFISNASSSHVNVGRELEKWAPDEGDLACLESLEQPVNGPKSTRWDQFAINEALFGVKSTFNEGIYTTKLVKGPHTRELEIQAANIAREIQGEQTADPHLAEERGLEFNMEIDEEMRYSAVTRPTDGWCSSNFTQQAVRHQSLMLAGPQGREGAMLNNDTTMSGMEQLMHRQPAASRTAPAARWAPPPHLLRPPFGSSKPESGPHPSPAEILQEQTDIASEAPKNARWTAPPVHVLQLPLNPAESSFILPAEAAPQGNNRDNQSRHHAARSPYTMDLPSSSYKNNGPGENSRAGRVGGGSRGGRHNRAQLERMAGA